MTDPSSVEVPVPPALIELAGRLADAAGTIARQYFRTAIAVDHKADESPVTQVDRGIEIALRRILEAERPADGIWGEEFGQERMEAEFVWVLDPIDGTKAFITGRPTFGTLIGLLWRGRPVLGVIDQPIVGDRWLGVAGQPTVHNGKPVTTRRCARLDLATISTTGPSDFSEPGLARFTALSEAARVRTFGGDCYQYGLLASGFLDIVVEEGLKLHDFAALAPVVIGAGGAMTDWQGAPLVSAERAAVMAVGDKALAPVVREFLQG